MHAVENPRLQRLKEKLAPYVFTLEWSKGKSHCIADALSRSPVEDPVRDDENVGGNGPIMESGPDLHVRGVIVSAIQTCDLDADPALDLLKKAGQEDPTYLALRDALQDDSTSRRNLPRQIILFKNVWDRLTVEDGLVLMDCQRIIVPAQVRKEVLRLLHLPHQGVTRTYNRARTLFFWPGMRNEIVNVVESCELCQLYQPSLGREPMKSDPPAERPFESVSVDLFEYGGRSFMALVDRYSGWPCFDSFTRERPTRERLGYLSNGSLRIMAYR